MHSPTNLKKQLRHRLEKAIEHLGGNYHLVASEINDILDSYSQATRLYHGLSHIADLTTKLRDIDKQEQEAGCTNSILNALGINHPNTKIEQLFDAEKTISAIGHDCVYISIDNNSLGSCESILAPYLPYIYTNMLQAGHSKNMQQLTHTLSVNAPVILRLVAAIFDYEYVAPPSNEFLSALAVAITLEKAGVSYKHIMSIASQIAASIPFQNNTPAISLRRNLEKLITWVIEQSPQDTEIEHYLSLHASTNIQQKIISRIITCATLFANEDVKGFRGNLANFIHNSFLLEPESSPHLRGKGSTPISYLTVLWREMHNINNFLLPNLDNIFHHNGAADAQQYPTPELLTKYRQIAKYNLEQMIIYLKAKQVAATFLYALTSQLGLTDILLDEIISTPNFPHSTPIDNDEESNIILQILRNGTGSSIRTFDNNSNPVRFDIGHSPLTAFMWQHQGKRGMLELHAILQPYIETIVQSYTTAMQKNNYNNISCNYSSHLLQLIRKHIGDDLFTSIYQTIYNQAPALLKEEMLYHYYEITGSIPCNNAIPAYKFNYEYQFCMQKPQKDI